MLKKAALEFGRALAQLAQLEWTCVLSRKLNPNVIDDKSGTLRRDTGNILGNLKRVCILADMQEVLAEIDRFGALISTDPVSIEDVKGSAHHLLHRILEELDSEHYFQIDRHEVRYYGKKELFGPQVSKKLKDAAYDIEHAGNCLALQEPTACVFHLMRAMEVALRSLSTRLKVKIGPKDTLGKVLNDIAPKINAMPDRTEVQKRKKERWAEARANLFHVKQAWRDNSMHGKQIYDREHAYAIFRAVGTFMTHLASL